MLGSKDEVPAYCKYGFDKADLGLTSTSMSNAGKRSENGKRKALVKFPLALHHLLRLRHPPLRRLGNVTLPSHAVIESVQKQSNGCHSLVPRATSWLAGSCGANHPYTSLRVMLT